MKISKITLIDSKSERVSVNLTAKIRENGDLVLEGQDLGNLVEETFGDSDYEYALKIKAEFKDTILLNLIRERFANDADFRAWLDEKEIPNEFWSF